MEPASGLVRTAKGLLPAVEDKVEGAGTVGGKESETDLVGASGWRRDGGGGGGGRLKIVVSVLDEGWAGGCKRVAGVNDAQELTLDEGKRAIWLLPVIYMYN